MNKLKEIDNLYNILVLYEGIGVDKSSTTVDSYLKYIDRLYVKWLGIGEAEIYETLKGLWKLGEDAGHDRVKSMVFHMISFVEKGL